MRAGVCPVAGCDRHLAPAKPFCYQHWFQIPPVLQERILWQQKQILHDTQAELWRDALIDDLVEKAVELLTPPVPEPLE